MKEKASCLPQHPPPHLLPSGQFVNWIFSKEEKEPFLRSDSSEPSNVFST